MPFTVVDVVVAAPAHTCPPAHAPSPSPDSADWFSGAFVMYGDDYALHFPSLDAEAVSRLRLLWLACGTEDFLIGPHRKFEGWMKAKGVKFRSKETPGAHTWMVWRRYLSELAPLLFRERES